MEITIGASVYGPEGNKIGEVGYVVCDGQTQQVTHVVVSKGWPPPPVDATANVPPGSVTLDDGMDIWAGDDKVGTLAGVRMHPRTEQVSHLVVSSGGLMAEERLVPRRAIATIDAQGIHLALTPDEVHRLPSVETT